MFWVLTADFKTSLKNIEHLVAESLLLIKREKKDSDPEKLILLRNGQNDGGPYPREKKKERAYRSELFRRFVIKREVGY